MIPAYSPADPEHPGNGHYTISAGEAAFAFLLALLSTLLSYRYAASVQIEQLPIILRQMDPGYLANDFFVATSTEFGPRLYFAKLLAFLGQLVPLPWLYAALTLLSDLALVLVTLWAARTIVGTDRLGAALAAAMVMGLSDFHLGNATQIRYEVFQPASLAIPGALWAIGLGLRGRPVIAAVVAALVSLSHPLYGAQGGAIALGTAFFVLLIPTTGRGSKPAWGNALLRTSIGAVVLGAFLAVFWWLPYRGVNQGVALSTAEIFDILAYFRAPHHYLPSHFFVRDYVIGGLFLVAAGFAYERWSRGVSLRSAGLLLLPVLAVLAGCLAGTLFTEIWPSRAILTLQPFRLLSILKWVGYLLLGWLLASYWQKPPATIARPMVALSLISAGYAHSVVTSAALALLRFRPWLRTGLREWPWLAGMVLAMFLLWWQFGSFAESLFMIAAVGLVAAFNRAQLAPKIGAALITGALVVAVASNRGAAPAVDLQPVVPLFDLSDHRDMKARTARAAAQYSEPDALFVAPPHFGLLRVIGQRALVVDIKSIPLQDGAMRDWRKRIRVVYGDVDGDGFVALAALDKAYRSTTDAHLRELAEHYGATHAVLYSETATDLPQLYANDRYRVVQLSPQPRDARD
jgi:hypothetical protein